jgi:hypothetical protein
MDLEVLGEHVAQCSAANGRLAALQCGAGHMLGFVSTRLVTTGAVVVGLTGALLMWW